MISTSDESFLKVSLTLTQSRLSFEEEDGQSTRDGGKRPTLSQAQGGTACRPAQPHYLRLRALPSRSTPLTGLTYVCWLPRDGRGPAIGGPCHPGRCLQQTLRGAHKRVYIEASKEGWKEHECQHWAQARSCARMGPYGTLIAGDG